jgi:hypothetical protein
MGRSNNNFNSWTRATDVFGDRVSLPEADLWTAVLCRAVLDACKGPPKLDMTRRANVSHGNQYTYDRDQARHFFLEGGSHFRHVCEMAGRDPAYVQEKIRKIILRKGGWNVDVPITSHYRQGLKVGRWKVNAPAKSREKLVLNFHGKKRGRPKKKHLTGNAYYAAKAKEKHGSV